jgi:flagellar protein FlaG
MEVQNSLLSRLFTTSVDRSVEPVKKISEKQAATNDEQQELEQPITKELLEKKIDGINKFVSPMQTSIKFQLHEKLNEYYVEIIDEAKKEVIRQIPSKKFLDMYASMAEHMGFIVDKKI